MIARFEVVLARDGVGIGQEIYSLVEEFFHIGVFSPVFLPGFPPV